MRGTVRGVAAAAVVLTLLSGGGAVSAKPHVAPERSTATPVPGQDVTIWGLFGSRGDKVRLQQKVGGKWQSVQKDRAGRKGSYSFSVRAGTVPVKYRATIGRKKRARVTRAVELRPVTGAQLRSWNDLCRGSLTDEAEIACVHRDDAIRALGTVVARDFHQAWAARDEAGLRALSAYGQVADVALTIPVTATPPDCTYDPGQPRWFCWATGTNGYDVGYALQVTAFDLGQLPVWRVVIAGTPDV